MIKSHPSLVQNFRHVPAARALGVDLHAFDLSAEVNPVPGRQHELHPEVLAELHHLLFVPERVDAVVAPRAAIMNTVKVAVREERGQPRTRPVGKRLADLGLIVSADHDGQIRERVWMQAHGPMVMTAEVGCLVAGCGRSLEQLLHSASEDATILVVRAVATLITLLAVLLHGFAPASALGAVASCSPAFEEPELASVALDCCGKPEHQDSKDSEPAKDPCTDCRSCFCCKVAPSNLTFAGHSLTFVGTCPVGDVLAGDELLLLSVSTIPDVPPPRA